jgi:hypothetical protein
VHTLIAIQPYRNIPSVWKTFEENGTNTDRLVLDENIACKYQWHCLVYIDIIILASKN